MAATQPAVRSMPRNTWGTVSWLFMRISALALIILTLGHFAIQHVFNDVHNLDLAFVAARWSSIGWRIYDASLLALGIAHGFNGLRIVVDDYVANRNWNLILRWLILLVGAALIIVGMIAVIGGVRRT